MTQLSLSPYTPDMAPAWDAFVDTARNGTFLHKRSFMDYHADRFTDASIVVQQAGKMIGLFPANAAADTIYSHQGLTFGGLLYGIEQRAATVCEMLHAIIDHYRDQGYASLIYKPVPHLFHRYPAEDDLYAIHRAGAKLIRRDLSAAIPATGAASVSYSRKSGRKKALDHGVAIKEGTFFEAFHAILAEALQRHHTLPAHSVADFALLHQRVPEHVQLVGAFENDTLISGAWLFLFENAIHTQYLASSPRGRDIGGLDLLLFYVLDLAKQKGVKVSFGASTEQNGTVLNEGLMAQKEYFGARGIVLDHYAIAL
jgi:hypothetical protein